MRADMAKVLVERPRRGGQWSRKRRESTWELLPTKEGMRRRWTDHKTLNENLAPLRRFLASRVGRRWDAVYAEISAHLKPRNPVQQHVRSHLTDFVALRLYQAPDGNLEDHRWGGVDWRHYYDFYVDPCDGMLKRSRSDKARRREAQQRHQRQVARQANAETITLSSTSELHRLNGIWYRVEFLPLPSRAQSFPTAESLPMRRAVPQGGTYDILRHAWVTTGERYAASKHQLTTRELQQYKLRNLPA
jgi:hypothetical protein